MKLTPREISRSFTRALVRPVHRWQPLVDPAPGYSIVLGVPWALRSLLSVNLRFVAGCDLTHLHRIHVVFDRVEQPGGAAFIDATRERFSELPLEFAFHGAAVGRVVAMANRSKFYASTNWTTGLRDCQTRYAILHDFDLYPLQADFFERIAAYMRDEGLRFSGAEHASFDGLTEDDGLIGTWELGVDVQWLRANYQPADCYHAFETVNGRRVDLDAFNRIQHHTPQRRLTPGIGPRSFAHVKNLCSTYLLYTEGRPFRMAWRLHYLWYLQSLGDDARDLAPVVDAMNEAEGPVLSVDGRELDFAAEHYTCANVLRRELTATETHLFGAVRPEIEAYLEAAERFFQDHGDRAPLEKAKAASAA